MCARLDENGEHAVASPEFVISDGGPVEGDGAPGLLDPDPFSTGLGVIGSEILA